jgi:hypothetical protein
MAKRRYDKAAKRLVAAEATRKSEMPQRPPRPIRYYADGSVGSDRLFAYQSAMAGHYVR